MKNIFLVFLLVSVSAFSQDFDKNWIKVITYENDGKIKSAAAIVEKIQRKAGREHNEVQLIKCFFYKSKYMQVLDEDAQSKILDNLDATIAKSSIPTKAILNLVYGKCLQDYVDQNAYYLSKRTSIDSTITGNFLTWNANEFNIQIEKRLERSLENKSVLKKTKLTDYEPVFDFVTLEKFSQQSLYEYLLQEQINLAVGRISPWLTTDTKYDDLLPKLFGNTQTFAISSFDSIPSARYREILGMYQEIEKSEWSVERQLERIKFSHNYIIASYPEYLKALDLLQKKTGDLMLLQKIALEKAIVFQNHASKTANPDYNIRAIALTDSILIHKNRSNAYNSAMRLQEDITSKTVHVFFKKYAYNKEHLRARITYKNMDTLGMSIYKISYKKSNLINNYKWKDSIILDITANTKPFLNTTYVLKNPKDYFEHTTDLLLPELETGIYLVYFKGEKDNLKNNSRNAEILVVSDFVVSPKNIDSREHYQVLDRKSGKPIAAAKITINNTSQLTDNEGKALFKNINTNYSKEYPIEVTKGKDTLTISHYTSPRFSSIVRNNDTTKEEIDAKVVFYLDRGIYRPGQTVHYKGIAIQKNRNSTKVCPNVSFKITTENSEGDEFNTFEVSTNEFGSFSGEFTIPKNILTGTFTLIADEPDSHKKDLGTEKKQSTFWNDVNFDRSQINFEVEEYKRPKFEVSFEPVKEKFVLEQMATIKGKAKAFDGSTLSNAKVSYEVERQTFNSYFDYGESGNETIAEGEIQTDSNGNFSIAFIVKADPETDKKNLPVFNYNINATVTDINGETHKAFTSMKAGYHSLALTVGISSEINTKDKQQIVLNSTNLNNEFTAVSGIVELYYVSPFASEFKSGMSQPEIVSISNEAFRRLFPYEQPPLSGEKLTQQLLYTKKVNTQTEKTIPLDFISNYKSGHYKIVFTAKDGSGNEIKNERAFELIQHKDPYDTANLFTVEQVNANPQKDGFIKIKVKSVISEIDVNTIAANKGDLFFDKTTSLKNHEGIVTIPLQKDYVNTVNINFSGWFDNYPFTASLGVELKDNRPVMEFTTDSFRNRIQPGNPENWSFQLNSDQKLQESEVLASMYDSSLDQFSNSSWGRPSFPLGNYYLPSAFYLGVGDNTVFFRELNNPYQALQFKNEVTKLIWFNFNFNNKNTNLKEYKRIITKKAAKSKNSKLIHGIVSDATGPIPGVSVRIKGTIRETQTDFDGYYEIEATSNEDLEFSFIGLESTKVKADQQEINLIMEASGELLEEIVVTGYGAGVKRSNVTASVSTVKTEITEDNAIYSFNAMLEGSAPGVSITMNSDKSKESTSIRIRGTGSFKDIAPLYVIDGVIVSEADFKAMNINDIISASVLNSSAANSLYGSRASGGVLVITTKKAVEELTKVKPRKNLSEMAFFLPHLKTDQNGKLSFNFTSPEALTEWKFRLLAHDKNANSAYLERSVVTQKEIMLSPNFPRFLREKDTITIQCKIANITSEAKSGVAMLQLFDAANMEAIDSKTLNADNLRNFTVNAMGSTMVSWKIAIPEGLQGIQYKVVAKAGSFSDGEENIIPVLTNNMLVTESIPIWVRESTTKKYTFENLKNNTSTTLRNQQLTLEYTSNPAWMAIQSLPYLMEYEHECAEQTFARFYANAVASEIIDSNPKIAALFESWKTNGKLGSQLEQNEQLKSILLAETPWFADSQSEEEKKKNLALLFDLDKMKSSQEAIFEKLKQKQQYSGGFIWFDGGRENEYITRHIIAGFGHLKQLGIDSFGQDKITSITKPGVAFLDQKFLESSKNQIANAKQNKTQFWMNPYNELHYLYTRSFYLDQYPLSDNLKSNCKYYMENIKSNWLEYDLYEKGMAALTLKRFGDKATALKIIENLKQTSANNMDSGMYWIENKAGWYWYQAPIETQALLIEAFTEVAKDTRDVDAMKVWLLKNKQGKNWPTTKATTEAVYALLMQGSDWLSVKDNSHFEIGDQKILSRKLDENQKEAETGYIKIDWKAAEITKDMAELTVTNTSKVPGYGGFYWQYFEDLDKIKDQSGGILAVAKELYLKKNTGSGDQLQKITTADPLKIGDLVTVRLTVTAKEDLEYVHLKDMRASCFEPVDVLSGYEWKDRVGYYKSTKDVATNFFFDRIDKGVYVLEYDVRVNNKGDFSNGITTIQSMYAPEFAGHTKGIRVKINK